MMRVLACTAISYQWRQLLLYYVCNRVVVCVVGGAELSLAVPDFLIERNGTEWMDKQPKLCHTRRGRVRVRATTPCLPAGCPFWPVPAAFTRRQEHALLLRGSVPRRKPAQRRLARISRRLSRRRCSGVRPLHRDHSIDALASAGVRCDENRVFPAPPASTLACALFVWLISYQPTVLFSQKKAVTSNQPAVLFSQNKSASATSHQPNEHAVGFDLVLVVPDSFFPRCVREVKRNRLGTRLLFMWPWPPSSKRFVSCEQNI
jgi:hypothetical protein